MLKRMDIIKQISVVVEKKEVRKKFNAFLHRKELGAQSYDDTLVLHGNNWGLCYGL